MNTHYFGNKTLFSLSKPVNSLLKLLNSPTARFALCFSSFFLTHGTKVLVVRFGFLFVLQIQKKEKKTGRARNNPTSPANFCNLTSMVSMSNTLALF